MKLSIIIPTLNEQNALEKTLKRLSTSSSEIIVVDGGSSDHTPEIARHHTPHVLTCSPGRGVQQDTGARHAHGDTLMFLHADTILPLGFQHMIKDALFDPGVIYGALHLSIHPPTPVLRLIAFVANLRTRILKIPYGDQAIFMRKRDYFKVGGFHNLPIMEDVDLVRRLNRVGRFHLAPGRVITSARRWEKEGIVYTTIRNWLLMIRYLLGVSPHRLLSHYPDAR
jgi:rSAM/selenodomain-associated transferase 2